MPEAVIVATARTPIGRAFKGGMVGLRGDDLVADVVAAALAKVPGLTPDRIEDLHLGCGLPGGEQGFNMARVVTTLLGWETVPGTTITRYCASSLQTTRMAMHAIRAGEGHAFISAGVEMVSRYGNGTSDGPETARNPRFADAVARTKATAQGGGESYVAPEGLPDVYIPMGLTAENVARLTGTTREEMDDFAFASQQRYAAAAADGFWSRDVMPITLADGTVLDRDESPRLADRDKMATLQPVFRPDGLITAGNACPLNDGAAAVVVVSDVLAEELGLTPLARVVSTGVSGLSPELMGLGPVEASRRALASAGLTIDDMDIVEINEAFAAQVLPSAAQLGVDPERLNPFGGAIAVGHPFGMTGARITSTLINGLAERDGRYGLETMCVGGGQGMAMVLERLT
jgi:acetyl-CoA C-acetyltransferase